MIIRTSNRGGSPGAQSEGAVEGEDALAIFNEPDPALDLFDTASHESFHHYVQGAGGPSPGPWPNIGDEGGGRAQAYPIVAGPRLYRSLVANELLAAYENPDQRADHLANAAAWDQKWAQEFPQEAAAIPSTDLKEGTAAYFGRTARWMAATGDDPGDPKRRTDFLEQLAPLTDALPPNTESYLIGLLALLVSDEAGPSDAKSTIATAGVPPLSVLLSGVTPSPAPPPPSDKLTQNVEDFAQGANEPLGKDIDPFVAAIHDPAQWTLMLPTQAQKGSLQTIGFYSTAGVPYTILPEFHQTFQVAGGTIALDDVTAGLTADYRYFVVPLDPHSSHVTLEGTTLNLTGPHAQGTAVVQSATENGKQILYTS